MAQNTKVEMQIEKIKTIQNKFYKRKTNNTHALAHTHTHTQTKDRANNRKQTA